MDAMYAAMSAISLGMLLAIVVLWWRDRAEQRRERAEAAQMPPRPLPPAPPPMIALPVREQPARPPAVVHLNDPPRPLPPAPPPWMDDSATVLMLRSAVDSSAPSVEQWRETPTCAAPAPEPESCRASDYSSDTSSSSDSSSSSGGNSE